MTDLMRSKRYPQSTTSNLVTAETAATTLVTVEWERKVSNPTSQEPGRFRLAFPTSIAATSWVASVSPEYYQIGSPKQAAAKRANILLCTVAQLHEWEPIFKVERISGVDTTNQEVEEPEDDDSFESFGVSAEDDTDFDSADELDELDGEEEEEEEEEGDLL